MAPKKEKSSRSVTMRDVARHAGVSQPTVSRVLNGTTSAPISDETRERVLSAVEELNYHPNLLARSLRTQQTQMIAMLIADISNSFYHPIARAVQDVAREHNYDVLMANSDHLYVNELHFLEAVSRRPVDGVVMAPYLLTPEDFERFRAHTHIPIAVLGQHVEQPWLDMVHANDERALYEATRWLIEKRGHTRLGFVGVPAALAPGPRRFRGFSMALEDAGLNLLPEHIIESDFTLEGGRRAARQLIATGNLPTVAVVINDLMAIGLILEFQAAGYHVPEDIAVLGYDNIPEASIVRPALTTIAQDPRDMGQKLARALFERIKNPDLPRRVYQSTYQLVVRDSA